MAAQINGVTRAVQWSDFPTHNMAPPGEDEEADAAFTNATFRFTTQPPISWVQNTRPDKYHIEDSFVMLVELITRGGDTSWKASWVASQPGSEQQRLLTHERGHFGLVALLGRDCFNELRGLLTNQYDSVGDAQNAIDNVFARYTSKSQPVQDVYDSDAQTRHGFNQQTQVIWNGYIAQARTSGTPILTVLSNAGITV